MKNDILHTLKKILVIASVMALAPAYGMKKTDRPGPIIGTQRASSKVATPAQSHSAQAAYQSQLANLKALVENMEQKRQQALKMMQRVGPNSPQGKLMAELQGYGHQFYGAPVLTEMQQRVEAIARQKPAHATAADPSIAAYAQSIAHVLAIMPEVDAATAALPFEQFGVEEDTYYSILGVAPNATIPQITQQYKALQQRVKNQIAATEKGIPATLEATIKLRKAMLQQMKAYSVLSNPAQRKAYDQKIGK